MVTIIRLTYYVTLSKVMDSTWHGVNTYLWCVVEVGVGIICACMATLRPLMRKVFPSLAGMTSARKSSRGTSEVSGVKNSRAQRRYSAYGKGMEMSDFDPLSSKNSDVWKVSTQVTAKKAEV